MGVSGILREALGLVDGLRGFWLAASLARLHRVQGSEAVVEAAEIVARHLSDLGVDARVEVFRGELGLWRGYGFWEPRGWRLGGAVVEAYGVSGWEIVASASEEPLVAMVHSPGGIVEGVAGFNGKDVVLTDSPGWEGYYRIADAGASAVIGFHFGPGVRYWGLFPAPFAAAPRAPAVSLPGKAAVQLRGKRVRVEVDAAYMDPVTPVVIASIGDGPPWLLLSAHVCHPRPGAHDNASGVAAVAEALAALRVLLRERRGLGVVAVLSPEWTGLAAAFERGLIGSEQLVSGVSVDMVGAKPWETGGEARLVASISAAPGLLDGLLWLLLEGLPGGGYRGAALYEWGSDHDVLLGHGVPGSMVNEWPDKFYHTSMDTPDHLDPARLRFTAAALAAAATAAAEAPTKAADITAELHASLLHGAVAAGGDAEAAAKLAKIARKRLAAMARGSRWDRELEPGRRPPWTRSFLYLLGGEQGARLLEDSVLRERARLLATAWAAGGLEAGTLYYMAVHGLPPADEVAEAAEWLLEVQRAEET